jgi:hypothetical protein
MGLMGFTATLFLLSLGTYPVVEARIASLPLPAMWWVNFIGRRPIFKPLKTSSCLAPRDAYRTLCIAPSPELRAVFQGIREYGSMA